MGQDPGAGLVVAGLLLRKKKSGCMISDEKCRTGFYCRIYPALN